MRLGRVCCSLVLLFLGVLVPFTGSVLPAGAGTIGLDGTLTFPFPIGGGVIFDLVGTRGFTAIGGGLSFPARPECAPCAPGQPLGLSVTIFNEDLITTVTLEGTTYRVGGQLTNSFEPRLRLTFTGPTLFAPPVNVAPIVALTAPVSVVGIFAHEGIVEDFAATATGTRMLQRQNFGSFGELWFGGSSTYELSATPEPATLLLFGTTMAGIGLARWRRRKHSA